VTDQPLLVIASYILINFKKIHSFSLLLVYVAV